MVYNHRRTEPQLRHHHWYQQFDEGLCHFQVKAWSEPAWASDLTPPPESTRPIRFLDIKDFLIKIHFFIELLELGFLA